MTNLSGNMTGNYYVRAVRPAFHDAKYWLPHMRDRALLRRHALKLRFWGAGGLVEDLDLGLDQGVEDREDWRTAYRRCSRWLRQSSSDHLASADFGASELGPNA